MKKTILITNIPSHYRQEIFEKLSSIGVDFAFSDSKTTIQALDYSLLKSKVRIFKFFYLGKNINFVPRSVLASFSYDNIIITGDFRSIHVWLILLIANFTRKRVFLWGHSWYGREGMLKKFIKRRYFRLAYRTLTYGCYARNLMITEGFPASSIIPIYNSLSYEMHLNERKKLVTYSRDNSFFDDNDPYVIYIGRLMPSKKLTLVIDALKKIEQEKNNKIKFLVIGPEVDNGMLREYSSRIGMSHAVKFLGPIYDESLLGQYIFNSSACVSPGNVGLTAIHSLSFGTPVITHNNFTNQMPEFEAIIPGKTGVFFKENSIDSLADAICEIVTVSSLERERMRQSCFDEIDRVWNTRYQMEVFKRILE